MDMDMGIGDGRKAPWIEIYECTELCTSQRHPKTSPQIFMATETVHERVTNE